VRNSSRVWLRRENEAFAASVPQGAIVLDAGAGNQPYRSSFAHCTYEAADFEKVDKDYAQSTYVCDLASIPVEDGRFEAIVFNQVMEHLPDPLAVLREFRRVLKPGGRMICTAPLFYEEHEQPYDFYRYTQFGWRHLLTQSGFEIERIDWMEGYFGTVAYQMHTAARYLPRSPHQIAPGLMGWAAMPVIVGSKLAFKALAYLFYVIDERNRYVAGGFPKNYVVIARRGQATAQTAGALKR
jgi:SAM-dependent methyltransferase